MNPIGSRTFYCSNSRYCRQYVKAGDDMIGLPKTNYSVSLFSRNYWVGTCPVCGQVYFVILRIFSIKLEEFNKLMIQIWYLKIFVTLFSLSFSSISLHVSGSILCYMKRFAEDYVIDSCKIGSMSVSEQLRTYPSPNPATVDWWQVRVNVGLGEGLVRNCSDTDFDP